MHFPPIFRVAWDYSQLLILIIGFSGRRALDLTTQQLHKANVCQTIIRVLKTFDDIGGHTGCRQD